MLDEESSEVPPGQWTVDRFVTTENSTEVLNEHEVRPSLQSDELLCILSKHNEKRMIHASCFCSLRMRGSTRGKMGRLGVK